MSKAVNDSGRDRQEDRMKNAMTANPQRVADLDKAHVPATNVAELNERHRAIENAPQRLVEDVIELGNLLIAIKATIGHGRWGMWIREHLKFSERTAQLYIQIAENGPEIMDAVRRDKVPPSLRAIQGYLAAPRTSADRWSQYIRDGRFDPQKEAARALKAVEGMEASTLEVTGILYATRAHFNASEGGVSPKHGNLSWPDWCISFFEDATSRPQDIDVVKVVDRWLDGVDPASGAIRLVVAPDESWVFQCPWIEWYLPDHIPIDDPHELEKMLAGSTEEGSVVAEK